MGASDVVAGPRVVLQRGDLALIGAGGNRPVLQRNVDVDAYLGWTDGRLQFRQAPLADVVRELERWYAVEIRLPDASRGAVRFTGSFKDLSATDVIDAVARSLNLAYHRQADTLWLLPKSAVR